MIGFLSPKEISESVIEISKQKAKIRILPMLLLGFLAGVYIGFGAELYTIVTHDLARYLGIGFAKFLGGSVFSVGLMLVILGGAELFTGNCLCFSGVLDHSVSAKRLIRNWIIVYFANFAGAIFLVVLMYYSGLWKVGNFGVAWAAIKTATGKVNLSFLEAFCRGVGCNWLVCLAVWLAISGRDSVSKIFGIYFPIMAFVASGFEHSIANMYFIPMGLFLKGEGVLTSSLASIPNIEALGWQAFFIKNLIPVTLGNIIGGAIFVGGIYYLVFRQKGSAE